MNHINYQEILRRIQESPSLVHCITNYVTVNDVANMILASGASPIMADDEKEVEDITSICTSLVLNIGTLNERTIQSMLRAGAKANALGHPVVFDPVGAGASKFRTETAMKLLQKIRFSVIRGNISEIKTLCKGSGTTMGVDADRADAITEDHIDDVIAMARELSRNTGAVVVITGAIDLIVGKQQAYAVYNGDPAMSRITGTGCMLDGVIAGFIGSNQDQVLEACTAAVSAMGLCGEYAKEKSEGTSSMRMSLIDGMSLLNAEWMERGSKIESK